MDAIIAQIIQQYGLPGVVFVLLLYLIWQDRKREKHIETDREVWTNHLSTILNEDSKSRENLAVGLTKLAESVNNFQTRCGQIQTALQNEVDRLMKG